MRVASLLASSTEMLYAMGAGEQVVAISHECDFPAEALDKPRATWACIDSSAASQDIDLEVKQRLAAGLPLYGVHSELLRELRPDVVVTQAQCDVCAVKLQDVVDAVAGFPELAATRIVALNPYSLADVYDDIRRVGAAVERGAEAEDLVVRLQRRVQAVGERFREVPPAARPRVVVIEWVDPLMIAANWTPELVELAGGVNQLSQAAQHSTYARWEDVQSCDPDCLIVAPCGFDRERAEAECRVLAKLPGWDRLQAVRNGRVFPLDGNAYFNRSGPRLVDTIEMLAECFGIPGAAPTQRR